jgi:peptidoglycan/LPS O-acetylase OafA/YrhL
MEQDLSREYVPGIDGLRAIAVSAVILFHMDALPCLRGGFTGVDAFFVISGYVISKSLASKPDQRLGPYLLGFYRRRLVRILPALLAMLLVTTLASALFIPTSWLSRAMDNTGLSAFLGCSNFKLARDVESYFSPKVELNPFLHTWSLAVEEQFYLVFPLLIFCRLKRNEVTKTHGRMAIIRIIPRYGLFALAGISFLVSILETGKHDKSAYYLLPSRFWELAAGAMLFHLHSLGLFVPKRGAWSNLLILAGLGIEGAGFLMADLSAFPFPWALPAVLGTAFLICGVIEREGATTALQRALSSSVPVYVGRISYSLYLWHWPVSALFRWTFGFASPASKGLYVLVTFVLAVASYRFIETPVRRSSFIKKRKSWEMAALSLAAIAAAYFSAWRMWESRPELSLSVTKNAYIWQSGRYEGDGPEEPITADPRIRGRKLFAVGDSHAAAYRTMLNIVSKELGIDVREYEQGDCAVAGLLKPMDERAEAHYEKALREIRETAGPGDVVFLPALRMPVFADQFEPANIAEVAEDFFGEEAVRNRERALEEADAVIDSFTKTGAYVVMEAPLPVLLAPPYRCSDWFNRMNPIGANGLTVSRAFLERMRQPAMESISALSNTHAGLYVWDPFPILCTDETFSAYDEKGEPLFWDGDHLSGNGNRILAPSFREFLLSIWTRGSS